MSESKNGDAVRIGAALAKLEFAPMPAWSDAQWSEREARVKAERAEDAARAQRQAENDRRNELLDLGWPVRALDVAKTITVSDRPALRFVMDEWKHAETSIVVLAGEPGIGKTVAAALWALRRAKFAPTFLRATSFANASRFDDTARKLWATASGLVLDDLGAEYADAKGNFQSALDELVDVYYAARKPLVITTNLAIDAVKARYGARIVDRLRECARFREFAGESLRKRTA